MWLFASLETSTGVDVAHWNVARGENEASLQPGPVLEFTVPHCDPTVNLHDQYWIREADGLIYSSWPISARGCSW